MMEQGWDWVKQFLDTSGGPAFPVGPIPNGVGGGTTTIYGMTLRDYFAAAALQGWIASDTHVQGVRLDNSSEHASAIAAASYRFADAMLAEREHKP